MTFNFKHKAIPMKGLHKASILIISREVCSLLPSRDLRRDFAYNFLLNEPPSSC